MKKLVVLLVALFAAANVSATPVNINSADAKAISEALTGIGLKKAEAIIKYRTDKGPFKTAADLANVSGIGPKTVEKNKKDILLADSEGGAPKAEEPKVEKK